MGIQSNHQIPKAIPIGQLPEDYAERLISASKMLYIFIAIILVNHPIKNLLGQKLNDLCENVFPLVHSQLI